MSLMFPVLAGGFLTTSATYKAPRSIHISANGIVLSFFIVCLVTFEWMIDIVIFMLGGFKVFIFKE